MLILRFLRSRTGVAGIEFCFIAPLLIGILILGYEACRNAAMSRHLTTFTSSIAWDFAGINDPSSGVITAKGARLYEMATRVGLLVPELASANASLYDHTRYKIGFTMVQMNPTDPNCITSCDYTANIAWSWGDLRRACGALASAPNGGGYDPASLPAGAFQAGAVVVVDVQAIYQPVLQSSVFPQKTLITSAYYPVRNNFGGAYLPWDGVNDLWSGTKCPGYP
jgi:hypothetical protein